MDLTIMSNGYGFSTTAFYFSRLSNPFAHLGNTQCTPSDIYVKNVYFDWFNQKLCFGEHFQSNIEIFRFHFLFVKPQDMPKLL